MAVLSTSDRQAIWKEWMEKLSGRHEDLALTKADVLAAVQAVDDWVDANTAAFNAAIPQPARGFLSARQKAEILMIIIRRRWEVT